MEENIKIVYVYINKPASEAQLKAITNYRKRNIEKVRDVCNQYYKNRYNNDPEFAERQRLIAKKSYYKNKERKMLEKKSDLEFLNSFNLE
jgi:hypothetical protein